jgi:hypothetical protein
MNYYGGKQNPGGGLKSDLRLSGTPRNSLKLGEDTGINGPTAKLLFLSFYYAVDKSSSFFSFQLYDSPLFFYFIFFL